MRFTDFYRLLSELKNGIDDGTRHHLTVIVSG